MSKMGDIPVPLVLTRDQVRVLRGMVNHQLWLAENSPTLPGPNTVREVQTSLLNILNNAETAATIAHASTEDRIRTQPHWRCGIIHDGLVCPRSDSMSDWDDGHTVDGE